MKRAGTGAWLGTFGTTAAIMGLTLITGALTARLLQPAGRGELAAILYWPNVLEGFGFISLNEAVAFMIAGQEDVDRAHAIKQTALTAALLLGVCSIAIGWCLLPWLFRGDRAHLIEITGLYMLVFMPANMVNQTLLAADQGVFRFGRYNRLRLLQPVTYFLMLCGIWFAGRLEPATVALAVLIGLLVTVCTQLYLSLPISLLWQQGVARDLLKIGGRFHWVNLLLYVSTELDRALILLWSSNANVGLYAVATTVAGSGTALFAQSATLVLLPSMSSLTAPHDRRALMVKSVRAVMLLVGVSNLSLMILAVWIVPLLFGALYREAILPTMGLLFAYWLKAVTQVMERSLRGTGWIWPGVHSQASSIVCLAVLAYPAYRYAGLLGMALSVLVSQIIALLVLAWYAHRSFEIRITEWWGLRPAVALELWRLGGQLLRSRVGYGATAGSVDRQ